MKIRLVLALLAVALLSGLPGFAQEPYKLPPKAVLDIIDAPPTPRVSMNPARDTMLLIDSESMPAIAYLSQPIYRIAGIRITPLNNSEQVLSFNTGLTLKKVKDGTTKKIVLPAGIKFTAPRWSADGQYAVFPRYLDNGIELWVLNAATAEAKALTPATLNMVVGGGMIWTPDNRHVLVHMVLDGRGKEPESPRVPIGPNVQISGGKAVKTATYEDLLKTPYDEKLFDYYAAGRIVEVDVTTGQARNIGGPGIYTSVNPSPDGNYLVVTRIKKPYSYSLPYTDFARSYEIWSKNGDVVKIVADLPSDEGIPMRGEPTGPRNPDWQPLKPATLIWTEALDGGDPEKDVPFRDKFMALSAPFTAEPKEVLKLQHRAGGLDWLAAPGQALASESNWKRRWRTTYLVNLDQPQTAPRKIFDLSTQDNYANPGTPVTDETKTGERLVLQDKDWIYLQGNGASPQGDHPFLDRMDIKTLKKERLFQCRDPYYETFLDFDGASRSRIFISSESKTDPPNTYILDLKTQKKQALTEFKDPAPQMTKIRKELVKYKRDDGVDLSGTLYLPADYKEGQRLPVVLWAYPNEYSDASTAGQVRGSVNRFTFYRGTSQLFYVVAGYALLDNAAMPVIGDPKTMNETFVKQIVANAKAAIDKLDQMGVGDPKRVAVGGHSYGAFMTANLLARCDLFAAGIARSGAYNRTLTPFGFQSERRPLWEAKDTYLNMSPFMFADQIKTPILMIHGEMDNNSGTFPIQSERLFAALKGFGTQARLVMLPYESHGYSARESVLHVLAEMIGWCDTYVKNKK